MLKLGEYIERILLHALQSLEKCVDHRRIVSDTVRSPPTVLQSCVRLRHALECILQTMFTVIVHAPAHLNAFYISWSGEEPKTEKQHRVATFVKKICCSSSHSKSNNC